MTNLNIYLAVSFAIFTAGFFYAIRLKKQDKIPWRSFVLIVLFTNAIAEWFAIIPLIHEGYFIYKPLYAAFYVLESAIGCVDYSIFREVFGRISFWRIYTIILHILMPLTTYGVILSYFIKAFGWFEYTLFRGKKSVILFSDFSEKSKVYALRLKSKGKLMVFCNTPNGQMEIFNQEYLSSMIFTDQSELQVLEQIKKQNLTILELSDDNDSNLWKSVEIIRYLTNEKNKISDADLNTISLYTISRQPEAGVILDNLMGRGTENHKKLHQFLVNEYKQYAFNLVHESPIYEVLNENSQTLDVMIVGFGKMGREVLKAVSWAGCFPNIDTNIHVIAKNAEKDGEILLSECPELGVDLRHDNGIPEPLIGVRLNPDAPIYYYNAEANTQEFDDIIHSLSHCGYIVISLGNDAKTLTAALHIYRLIMRDRLQKDPRAVPPRIHIRIRDNKNLPLFMTKDNCSILKHFKQFGCYEEIYGQQQLGKSEIDQLAENVLNIYRNVHQSANVKNIEFKDIPETEKNENRAAAVHAMYKLAYCGNITVTQTDENLSYEDRARIREANQQIFNEQVSEAERVKLAEWEHIRWQAYLRTEGFIHCDYEETKAIFDSHSDEDRETAIEKTRAALREVRIHPTIGDADHLRKVSTLLGDPNDPDYYYKNDKTMIDWMPEIIGEKYQLSAVKKAI